MIPFVDNRSLDVINCDLASAAAHLLVSTNPRVRITVSKSPFFMYVASIEKLCIVIREVQYQFEVNRCRNEEIIVKGNFGWVWSMWAGRPRVGNGAMHS